MEVSIVTVNNYVTVKGTVPKAFSVVKYKWDEEKSVNFAILMQFNECLNTLATV